MPVGDTYRYLTGSLHANCYTMGDGHQIHLLPWKKNYSTNRFSQNAIVQISFLGDWLHQNPCKSRETLNITAKNGSIKNWKAIQNPIVRVVFTWQKSNDRCSITSKSSPNACDHHEFSSISSKFPYCLPSGDQTWLAGKSNVSKADFPAMFEILFYHYEIPDQKPMLP
jgi:hypothetical protein